MSGSVHGSHSSFLRRSFVEPPAHAAARMRWSGQIFWLLACGAASGLTHTFFPPSPSALRLTIGSWEVVSSYSSATAPDSHGISRADPLIKLAKNYPVDNRRQLGRQEQIPVCSKSELKNFMRPGIALGYLARQGHLRNLAMHVGASASLPKDHRTGSVFPTC